MTDQIYETDNPKTEYRFQANCPAILANQGPMGVRVPHLR